MTDAGDKEADRWAAARPGQRWRTIALAPRRARLALLLIWRAFRPPVAIAGTWEERQRVWDERSLAAEAYHRAVIAERQRADPTPAGQPAGEPVAHQQLGSK